MQRAANEARCAGYQIKIIGAHYAGLRRTRANHLAKIRRHNHRRRQSRRARYSISSRLFCVFHKNRHSLDIHYLLQTADQCIQQWFEGGGSRKRATEIKQTVAHVIPLAIKQAVGALLQIILHRRGNHDDYGHYDHGNHDAQSDLA
jgi:hypothetical protein